MIPTLMDSLAALKGLATFLSNIWLALHTAISGHFVTANSQVYRPIVSLAICCFATKSGVQYADFIKEELGGSYMVDKLAKRMLGESV